MIREGREGREKHDMQTTTSSKPYRILIVGLGGVTHTFRHWPERVLALALARRGHQVRAIGTRDPTRPALAAAAEVIEGVTVRRVRSAYWPNQELAHALEEGPKPDLIHLLHPRNVLAAQTTAWAQQHGIPTVYTWLGPFHDHYLIADRERPLEYEPTYDRLIFTRQTLVQRMLRELRPRDLMRNYWLHWPLAAASALAPCSAFEAEIMRRFGLTQPMTTIPLWIDRPFIVQTPRIQPTYAMPRPWLLFVGQITPRKGYDLAVATMPSILQRYPEASLLIVSGLNQARREELLRLAASHGVERHIHMLGYLPDDELINLYRASDLLLFPTRYEGFGLPLLEAMAAECPLVTTDIPVVREIVRDGENGLLAPYNNPHALAQAALRLLDHPDLRAKLIAGGHAALAEYYAEARLIAAVEQVYAGVRR